MKYVLVSQGIKIAEFDNKTVAEEYMREMNEKFYQYKQQCIDNGEFYADNEIFMYEER